MPGDKLSEHSYTRNQFCTVLGQEHQLEGVLWPAQDHFIDAFNIIPLLILAL